MSMSARRPVLLVAALLASLVASLAACTSDHRPPPPPRPSGRPNIIFVLTDDLATNLVPYMPHVLALERAGMTFTNYTVTDSLCCPSRSSIFSGRYPHNTHVLSNTLPDGGFRLFHRRGEEQHTFATALSAAGYRTAMLGKYLNGYKPAARLDERSPYVPPGWSEWDVANYSGYDEYGYRLNENHQVVGYGKAPQDYLTTVLNQRAEQFVRSSAAARRPFLLEVATFTPHRPYVPAPSDAGTFPGVDAPRGPAFDRLPSSPPGWLAHHPPLTTREESMINRAFRKRVEDVQSVDRMLGELERTVQRTGQADNTYFVFSSDNGYHMGEYRLAPGKLTAFDTDIRVPLIVAGPGVPAGVRNPAIVQNVDLAPTFDQIGGAAVPAQTDGRSLLPLLHGHHPSDWPTLALIEHDGRDLDPQDPDYPPRGSGNPPTYQAIRGATFTYVRYRNGDREFYNRRTDPYELHNLAGSLPAALISRLDAELTALHTCAGQRSCQRAGYVPYPLGRQPIAQTVGATTRAADHAEATASRRVSAAASESRRRGGSSRR